MPGRRVVGVQASTGETAPTLLPRSPERVTQAAAARSVTSREETGQGELPRVEELEQTMSDPKLHHYVPQFYLRRFVDNSGRLWVWDRDRDCAFATSPATIAAESRFYYLDDFAKDGHDPLSMERQFASLEYEVARVSGQWIDWIREGRLGMPITVPEANRELFSLFLGLQFLRTAESRDMFSQFAMSANLGALSEVDKRRLHLELLWDDDLVEELTRHISSAIWVFGRNTTDVTSDNTMWLKAAVLSKGTYLVYPLSPDVVIYCYPREQPWSKLERFDCSVSPVTFTKELVENENSAQVFMASRFVISCRDNFVEARNFACTIGTDTYARVGRRLFDDPGESL
jgi:hypothetical protein